MTEHTVVMVSSTVLDLDEHRAEIRAACESLDFFPKMMESLPALDADAIRASLDLVNEAEVYLGVFAYRYGYVAKGRDSSITEMEYKRACEKKLPKLVFLIHEDHPVKGSDVEAGSGSEEPARFKEQLSTDNVVAYFRSPEDLRAKVFQALVKLREDLRAQPDAGVDSVGSIAPDQPLKPPAPEDNPYRSLSAFREEDSDVFFGRGKLVKEMLAEFYALTDPGPGAGPRLFAILGPSGSGKSSIARAGLAASLNRQTEGRGKGKRVFTFIPGEHPMSALAETIRVASEDAEAPVVGTEPASEEDDIPPPTSPLSPLPESVPDRLVLLVDQFEEVYSLCDSKPERDAFVSALMEAVAEPEGRVSLIITMRSDFLGETQRHSGLNTAITRHAQIVPAMSAEELRLAITEPARLKGHPVDESTVGRLIDETIGHEGVLPLLQFVLSAIWRGMATGIAPENTVQKLGGVGGALANHAEELFKALPEDKQRIARRAFIGMVQLGEGAQDTRRRVALDELRANDSLEHVRKVLDRFAEPDRRLVTV